MQVGTTRITIKFTTLSETFQLKDQRKKKLIMFQSSVRIGYYICFYKSQVAMSLKNKRSISFK